MDLIKFTTWLNTNAYTAPSARIQEVCATVNGFSAPAIMSILSAAVACLAPDEVYLEIGTYQGRSLCGALVDNPTARALAVDNFSEFQQADAVAVLEHNLAQFDLAAQVKFYQEDTQAFLAGHTDMYGRVGVYFYDGNHNTDQGLAALHAVLPFLAPRALIFMDDYSGAGVWASVARLLGWHWSSVQPVFVMATPHFPRGTPAWHNGIAVLAYQKYPTHISLLA